MVNETILAVIIAFVVSAVLCPIVIPFLHRLKFGQQVRDDGPQTHLKKQGTPTMGGLVILSSIIITSLLYIRDDETFGGLKSDPEADRTVCDHRYFCLLYCNLTGHRNRDADSIYRQVFTASGLAVCTGTVLHHSGN